YKCQPTLYFFFQAEDGIRDLTVTGVQTCALPISSGAFFSASVKLAKKTSAAFRDRVPSLLTTKGTGEASLMNALLPRARKYSCRSEERRVGKECRWRWGR